MSAMYEYAATATCGKEVGRQLHRHEDGHRAVGAADNADGSPPH